MRERDKQDQRKEMHKTILFFIDEAKYRLLYPDEFTPDENSEESAPVDPTEFSEIDRIMKKLNKTGILTAQDLEEGWQ